MSEAAGQLGAEEELRELQRRVGADEAAAVAASSELAALRTQLAAFQKLQLQREAAEVAIRLEQRTAATELARRDETIRALREELTLESDILAAVRAQVAASERARDASERQLAHFQRHVASAGAPAGAPAGASTPAAPPADGAWAALLEEKVGALESALGAANARAEGLEGELRVAREALAATTADGPLELAKEEGAAAARALSAELEATQERLLGAQQEAAASGAVAEHARARIAEQAAWIERRDRQLGSARREIESVHAQLSASAEKVAELTAEIALVTGGASSTDGAAGGAGAGGTYHLEVDALRATLAAERAASSSALGAERQSLAEVETRLAQTSEQLEAERARRREASEALREAQTSAAALVAEGRTRALEVARLSQELGALQARQQAGQQQVRSAEELVANLRAQKGAATRELELLRSGTASDASLHVILKAAVAAESSRVAKAWEQREALRERLGARDGQLLSMQAELFKAREELAAKSDEVDALEEARRLSEILASGAEQRCALKQTALEQAQRDAQAVSIQLASATARLGALESTELAAHDEKLAKAGAELKEQQLVAQASEGRAALLASQLASRTSELVGVRAELAARIEAERSLREGDLAMAREEIEAARSSLRLAELEKASAVDAAAREARRAERAAAELAVRGEQLQITHEGRKLLELEAALLTERCAALEETLETERSRHEREGAMVRLGQRHGDETAEALRSTQAELGAERERCSAAERALSQREAALAAIMEELEAAEMRGKSREAARRRLVELARTRSEEVALRDERMRSISAELATSRSTADSLREEVRMLAREVASSGAEADGKRDELKTLRARTARAEAEALWRAELAASLEEQLQAARETMVVQVGMLEDEMRAAVMRMDAKDAELELTVDELTSRERSAHALLSTVSERLQKAHRVMAAKDELNAALGARLTKALAELKAEAARAEAAAAGGAAAGEGRAEIEAKLSALQEMHDLATDDLKTAASALDNYRESLVSAEAKMARDKRRIDELQTTLRTMQTTMFERADAQTLPTGGGFPLPLPPLSGRTAAEPSELRSSRVHFLYFLSSFLLLKVSLSVQGQMANVNAQDVYDEVIQNQVPLEEWPTYIFTRVYSPSGTASSTEALRDFKAHARADAKRRDAEGGGARDSGDGAPKAA